MLQDFKRYWHNDQSEIQLLLDFDDADSRRRRAIAYTGAAAAEFLAISVLALIPAGASTYDSGPRIVAEGRSITPLVAPPPEMVRDFQLTQREPQRGKPVTEVNLEGLLPRPGMESAPPGAPPPPKPLARLTLPPGSPNEQLRVDAPRIELPAQGVSSLPAAPPPSLAAPVPERPKLAFEQVGPPPGTASGSESGTASRPRLTVDDVVKPMGRGAGGAGQVVGDAGVFDSPSLSEMMRQSPSPGRPGSALQLLSDPQGVDFRPYMTQVLAAVKRNWLAVFPESARMGQRGRSVVQFSVNRQGQVPKLVIAVPAGTQALDRAAVAGVSASVPFPPLPAEFKGTEIRLQLVFSYNMPSK